MPGPHKPFPSISKRIDEVFEKKHMDIHNERVAKAQAKVDSSEPTYMHTNLGRTNPKRLEAQAEAQYEIDKTNAALVNKLLKIEQMDSSQIIKPALGRTTMSNHIQGMYYPTIDGNQLACIDHINATATSNPRSLHYRSNPGSGTTTPTNGRSRSCSRAPSVSGSMHDSSLVPDRSVNSFTSSAGPAMRTSMSGSQPWTGQLARRTSHDLVPTLRRSNNGSSVVLDAGTAAALAAEASAGTGVGLMSPEVSTTSLDLPPGLPRAPGSTFRSASPNRMAQSADTAAGTPPLRRPSPSRLAQSAETTPGSVTSSPRIMPPRPPLIRGSEGGRCASPAPAGPGSRGPSPGRAMRPIPPLPPGGANSPIPAHRRPSPGRMSASGGLMAPSPDASPAKPAGSGASRTSRDGSLLAYLADGSSSAPPPLYSSRGPSPARASSRGVSPARGVGAGSRGPSPSRRVSMSNEGAGWDVASLSGSVALPGGGLLELRAVTDVKQDTLKSVYLQDASYVKRGNSVMAVRRSGSGALPRPASNTLQAGAAMTSTAGSSSTNSTPRVEHNSPTHYGQQPQAPLHQEEEAEAPAVDEEAFVAAPAPPAAQQQHRYANLVDSVLSESGDLQ